MTASEQRIVFDTNVLISAALKAEGKPRRALMTALSEGQVLMSAATFEELETRLARRKFDKYLTQKQRALFLDWLHGLVTLIDELPVDVQVCADPDDDKFLNLALSAGATYLVTGNLKDFPAPAYEGVAIVTPARFVEEF